MVHYRDVGELNWMYLTRHTRVLLCIARDPAARLREIAASLGITERSAYAIIIDLTEAGAELAGVPRGAGRQGGWPRPGEAIG
jgi:hypothetical protein